MTSNFLILHSVWIAEFKLQLMMSAGSMPRVRWQAPFQLFTVQYNAIEIWNKLIKPTIVAKTLKGRFLAKNTLNYPNTKTLYTGPRAIPNSDNSLPK